MRNLSLLKTLVDIFFYFGILAIVGTLIIFLMFVFGSDADLPITVKGQIIETNDAFSISVLTLVFAGAMCFFYAIYRLRAVLTLFMKREVFSDNVVAHFNVIGKSVIASAVLTSVPMFFYDASKQGNVKIEFSSGGFNSFLMSVSLGLLFMVIAEIFKKAKNMKEENELTV